MDLAFEDAEKIAETLLRRPAKDREEVLAMVAELANIVGIACSMLNKRENRLGYAFRRQVCFMVTPPSS